MIAAAVVVAAVVTGCGSDDTEPRFTYDETGCPGVTVALVDAADYDLTEVTEADIAAQVQETHGSANPTVVAAIMDCMDPAP